MQHDVLLLWEEVPKGLEIYELSVDDISYAKLRACHGKFCGEDLEPELAEWIIAFLADKIYIYSREFFSGKEDIVDIKKVGRLIVTGYFV